MKGTSVQFGPLRTAQMAIFCWLQRFAPSSCGTGCEKPKNRSRLIRWVRSPNRASRVAVVDVVVAVETAETAVVMDVVRSKMPSRVVLVMDNVGVGVGVAAVAAAAVVAAQKKEAELSCCRIPPLFGYDGAARG